MPHNKMTAGAAKRIDFIVMLLFNLRNFLPAKNNSLLPGSFRQWVAMSA